MTFSHTRPAARAPAIPRRGTSSAPLSYAQQGLWFLDQFAPGSPRYNIPMALQLDGPLDVEVLARAVVLVVRRHEILRTTFIEDRGEPRQIVSTTSSVQMRFVDASAIEPAKRGRVVPRLVRQELWQPFELAQGPLLRISLWRMAADQHVLTATMHHIIADAWSVNVLLREITTIYASLVANRPAALPPLPIQYGDYAAWERARVEGPAFERTLTYWENQLAGVEPLDLPSDRPRLATRTFAGAAQPWKLPREVSAGLRELARRERVTLFMLLVAVFAVLLRRYTHQDDLAIGSPMTTRQTRETEPLVGLFLNTLVLRVNAAGRQPFQRFLAYVRDVVLGAFMHRDAPFERLVEHLRPSRRNDAPLFNVMLAVHPGVKSGIGIDGVQVTELPVAEEAIRFDLTLFAIEGGDELSGVLSYSAELFDQATMARMSGHLVSLLQAIVERPSARLDELPLLANEERVQVLARGIGVDAPEPTAAGVHELFERYVELTPNAPAVLRDGQILSYQDVDRRANQIAHALIALGAGRGTRVALCLDRRPPLVLALLGIMKSGACYVPLDPTYPARRLQGIVEDARPTVLLTETRFASLWHDLSGVTVVYLDASDSTIASRPTVNPGRKVTPDDPVYIIYTSGSTGTPKGVIVPHGALINSCRGVVEATGIGPGDRFLHFAPIGFDVTAFQIYPALTTGAATVLAPPASELSNDDILEICERTGLTILDLPSAVWQQWVKDMADRGRRLPAPLRVFMTGGESTPMECVRAWSTLVEGSTRFISSYGPTETTVTTMWRGAAADAMSWGTPSITLGGPLQNVRLYVLDAALQPVPPGVSGELCVAGAGLAHGYVDRPDLTAERFVPDPISSAPGQRMYRTGDRVRYRADGLLEFLGRFDHQLKLLGVRIEAGEIEALLRQHPRVRAAVVTTARPASRPVLVAYIVADAPVPGDAEMRQHLAAHLPSTVIPTAFCFLPALPITPNGKLDRRALPMPDLIDAERAIVEPRTETERLLIEMWSEALGVTGISADDDFFAVGGHSIVAARLASRLREAFGIDLSVRAMFEAPTVAQLGKLIDDRRRSREDERRPALVSVERKGPMPVSFAQQGFWLLEQFEPERPIYANPEVVRFRGALSVPAFVQTLTAIVGRHESLRTTFRAVDGAPKQIIEAARPVDVPVIDLEALPPGRREAAATELARVEAHTPFNLSRGPMLRVTILRMAADDHIVHFTMHHIVSDLWSIGVLMTEVGARYRAALTGEAVVLPDLPVQYADYAAWERVRWNERALDEAVVRRLAQIGDVTSELSLPTDRPRALTPRFSAARRQIEPSDQLLARVRLAGRRDGVTLFMSMLAALQTLLHLYTGEPSILVAVPVANRDEHATEHLIGYFVNHVVIVTRFDGEPTCRELLARARTATLEALDHQDLPFEEFVRRVRPERQGSHTPLHRVVFNVLNVPDMRLDLPGLRAEVAPPAARERGLFDLNWAFADHGDHVTGLLEYDAELFDPSTADRMASGYIRVLEAFADTPDRRLATLNLMTSTQESLALAFSEPL